MPSRIMPFVVQRQAFLMKWTFGRGPAYQMKGCLSIGKRYRKVGAQSSLNTRRSDAPRAMKPTRRTICDFANVFRRHYFPQASKKSANPIVEIACLVDD